MLPDGQKKLLFPAYAGVIPVRLSTKNAEVTFPRICGGDPNSRAENAEKARLFPAYAGVIP